MEQKSMNIPQRTPEEIKAWFKRRKDWYEEEEKRAHAMWEEEQRLKREAKEQHKYELEYI